MFPEKYEPLINSKQEIIEMLAWFKKNKSDLNLLLKIFRSDPGSKGSEYPRQDMIYKKKIYERKG